MIYMDLTPEQIKLVEDYISNPKVFSALLSQADNLEQVKSYNTVIAKYWTDINQKYRNGEITAEVREKVKNFSRSVRQYYLNGQKEWEETSDIKLSQLTQMDLELEQLELNGHVNTSTYKTLKENRDKAYSGMLSYHYSGDFLEVLGQTTKNPPVQPKTQTIPPVGNITQPPTPISSDNLIERTYEKRAEAAGQDVKTFVANLQETISLDTSSETVRSNFKGIDQAVSAIDNAILNKQKIFIYGDYDVDGITSATITENSIKRRMQVLRDQGHNISFNDKDIIVHLPQRSEGYGINEKSLESLSAQISEGQKALMITVDTGTGAWDKLDKFADKFNYVITDHHLPAQGETVESVMKDRSHIKTILNPHYKGTYGFEHLSGAGVAFKLSQALGGGEADVDLTALGTIADMVPLEGENRGIVQKGLEVMNSKGQGNESIKKLWERMQKNTTVTSEGVAYYIAPAINAGGRVGEEYDKAAGITDPKKTGVYAPYNVLSGKADKKEDIGHLVAVNEDRRQKTGAAVKDIEEKLKGQLKDKLGYEVKDISQGLAAIGKKSTVVHKEGLAYGLIGLVAGKLQERYHVPTIVFSGEEGDIRGSARSVEGLNLKDTLDKIAAVSDGPLKPGAYGGHEGAAGLSVEKDRIKEFADAFDKEVKQVLGDYVPQPSVDLRLSEDSNLVSLFTPDSIKSLESTAPFGQGNPRPTYQARVQISDIKHLQNNVMTFNVFSHGDKQGLPAVIFDSTHLGNKISIDQAHYNGLVDITFQAGVKKEKRGKESVQLTVTDIGFLEGEDSKVADEDKILPFDKIEKAKADPEVQKKVDNLLKNAPDFSKPLGKDIPVAEAAERLAATVQEKDFREKTLQPLVAAYEQEYLNTAGDKALGAAEKLEGLIGDSDKIYENMQSLVDRYLLLDDKSSTEAKEMLKNIRGYLNSVRGPKQGIYFSDDIVDIFKQYSEEARLQLEETEGITPEEMKKRKVQALFADQAYEIAKQRKFTPSKSKKYKALGEKIEEYYGQAFDQLKKDMESAGLSYDSKPEQRKVEELNKDRPKDKPQVPVRNSWRYNQIRGQVQNWAIDHAKGLQEEIAALQAFANYYGIPEEDTKPSFETDKPSSVRKSLREAIVKRVKNDYRSEIQDIHNVDRSFGSDKDIIDVIYRSPRDPKQYFAQKLQKVREERDLLTYVYAKDIKDTSSLWEQLDEARKSAESQAIFQDITKDPGTFYVALMRGTKENDIWNYYKDQELFENPSGKKISFLESSQYKDLLGNYIDYLLEEQKISLEGQGKELSLTRKDFQWLIEKGVPAYTFAEKIQEKIDAAVMNENEKKQIVEELKSMSVEEFQKNIQYPKNWIEAFVTDKDGKIQRDPQTRQWIRQTIGKNGVTYDEEFYKEIEKITKNRAAWGIEEVVGSDGKNHKKPVNTYFYDGTLYRTEVQKDLEILKEKNLYGQKYLEHNNIAFDISGIQDDVVGQLEHLKNILAAESSKEGSGITRSLSTAVDFGQRIERLEKMSDDEFQAVITNVPGWVEKYFETDDNGKVKTNDKGQWIRKKGEDGNDFYPEEEYNVLEEVRKNREAWGTFQVTSEDGKKTFTRLKNVAYLNDKMYRIPDDFVTAITDKSPLVQDMGATWGNIEKSITYLVQKDRFAIDKLAKKYPDFYSEEEFHSTMFDKVQVQGISAQEFANRVGRLNDFYHDVSYYYDKTTGYLQNAEEVAAHLDNLSNEDFNKAFSTEGLKITHQGRTEETTYTAEEVRKFWNRARGRTDSEGRWQNGLFKVKGQYYRANEAPAGAIKRSNERAAKQQQQQQPKTPAEKAEKTVQNMEQVAEAVDKVINAAVDEGKKIVNSTEDTLVHAAAKTLGLPTGTVDSGAAQTAEAVTKKKTRTKIPNARKFAFGSHMPTMLGFMGTMGAITLFDSAFHSRGEDEYERYQRQRAEQRRRMYSGEFYG